MISIETEIRFSDEELETIRPVVISVIGPTNEGKTSILRTLAGDPDFGEISARTGSTTRTEYIRILYKHKVEILRLADTPGFQMSGAIADRIGSSQKRSIASILAAIPDEDDDFRHDRRAWEEAAKSDIIIYAANTAESPEQSLTADSLDLLGRVEKPVIVLFNTISSPAGTGCLPEPASKLELASNSAPELPSDAADYKNQWIAALQRAGLHLFQEFNAYQREFTEEYLLFEKICSLIHEPLARKAVRAEMTERIRQEKYRAAQSRRQIAELLLDAAEMTLTAENLHEFDWEKKRDQLRGELADSLAKREHQTHQELLNLWRFNPGILEKHHLRTQQDCSKTDHHLGQNWRRHSGSGAALGALVGLGVDAMFGGLSLGTGMMVGAFIGGLCGGTFNAVYDKKDKKLTVRLNPSNYPPLLSRSVDLAAQLRKRGQAVADTIAVILSREPKKIDADEFFWFLSQMTAEPTGFQKFQNRFQLVKKHFQKEETARLERKEKIDRLAESLKKLLPDP